MWIPNFEELEYKQIEQEQSADKDRRSWGWRAAGTSRHPNPYFYKYYTRVFWKGSPCDGHEFLNSPDTILTIKKAFDLTRKLETEGLLHYTYSWGSPRLDPINNPFDPNAERWEGIDWAPAYDDDTDEPVAPERGGHK